MFASTRTMLRIAGAASSPAMIKRSTPLSRGATPLPLLSTPHFVTAALPASSFIPSRSRLTCGAAATGPEPFTLSPTATDSPPSSSSPSDPRRDPAIVKQQRLDRRRQQSTYQFAAIAASSLIISIIIVATYYRIAWHLEQDDAFPYLELGGTLALALGGMVGMEYYARWIHRAAWHENEVGWSLHKSHHEHRVGAFELNDIYAVANAVPAIALCAYGFMRPDMIGGLCFGAGIGICCYGIFYVYSHDSIVHKRFPSGPLADVPWLRRVAIAHSLHHTDKYGGVPFGLFLGPQELEAVGGKEELDRLVAQANKKVKAP